MKYAPFPSTQECDFDEGVDPATIHIGTKPYKCSVILAPLRSEPRAEGAGFNKSQRLSAYVRKTLMPTPPEQETIITYNDLPYKILAVAGDGPTDPAWKIEAEYFKL